MPDPALTLLMLLGVVAGLPLGWAIAAWLCGDL